jgi:hypothetical protein
MAGTLFTGRQRAVAVAGFSPPAIPALWRFISGLTDDRRAAEVETQMPAMLGRVTAIDERWTGLWVFRPARHEAPPHVGRHTLPVFLTDGDDGLSEADVESLAEFHLPDGLKDLGELGRRHVEVVPGHTCNAAYPTLKASGERFSSRSEVDHDHANDLRLANWPPEVKPVVERLIGCRDQRKADYADHPAQISSADLPGLGVMEFVECPLQARLHYSIRPIPPGPSMSEITQILSQAEQGIPFTSEQLLQLLYDDLRKVAAQQLAMDSPGKRCKPQHWFTNLICGLFKVRISVGITAATSLPRRPSQCGGSSWKGLAENSRFATEAVGNVKSCLSTSLRKWPARAWTCSPLMMR